MLHESFACQHACGSPRDSNPCHPPAVLAGQQNPGESHAARHRGRHRVRVRGKRGDFEPLISEDLFYRAQAVLSGRLPSTTPKQRAHPDFPLRGFVRCASCGRGLTGSWSKGRNEYYAYYHCRPGCRAVNLTKAKLEGLFTDELALLQPTPGYMRLLKESVLQIWKAPKAAVRDEIANAERAAKAIQDKLDRLDEAFLFERSIDLETYDRHAEKLREELTLARIDRHSGQLDDST
jgi:Recombinase zinc beta ribbon domain